MPLSNKQLMAHLLAEYGELEAAMDDTDDGICHNCGHIQAGVEPDASNYKCENCGDNAIFGIEQTVICIL